MTDKEKAQEICEKNKRFKVECSSLECYLSAMEMAEWKERQMIEKACEWIRYNNENGGCLYDGWEQDFKKAMEEQQ